MESLSPLGKMLIVLGAILIVIGVLFLFGDKIPFLGKLPGDITIKKKNFTIYIPIATSILLSLLLTLIMYFINRK